VEELVDRLLDVRQPWDVRADVLRRLRAVHGGSLDQAARNAILLVARADVDKQLRLQATAALGDFARDADVSAALSRLIADPNESLEHRYFALTSLERGGPTPSSLRLLATVAGDADIGKTAASILSRWQARLRREPRPR
jgi:hypothetical protein